MPKRHYKWDLPEDNEERARRHRERNFDYEAEDFINQLYDLAAAGYYDYEIAKKVGIDAATFSTKCGEYEVMSKALAEGRKKIKKMGCEMPSVAYFKELVEECEGKASRILAKLGIGYATYRKWLKENPGLQHEVDLQNLKFLERLDNTAKLCACGVVRQIDENGEDVTPFPGFKLMPNSQLMMFYFNSVGAKYGYSAKEELLGLLESDGVTATKGGESDEGIDIDEWIRKEIAEKAKKRQKDIEDAGKESVNYEENNQPSAS